MRTSSRLFSLRYILLLAILSGFVMAVPVLPSTPSEDPKGVVTGRVVSSETRAEIQGAAVILLGLQLGGITGKNGYFHIANVPRGTHRLRVQYSGHWRAETTVTVDRAEQSAGTIALKPRLGSPFFDDPLSLRVVGARARGNGRDLRCVLRLAGSRPIVGSHIDIEMRIHNNGNESVILPLSLDDSDEGRYPRVTARVIGPPEGFVVGRYMRCGYENPLEEEDLVTVEPGGSFDPFARGWIPANLAVGRVRKPGTYRIIVQYSTDEVDASRWLGSHPTRRAPKPLLERLGLVPRVELSDSIEVVVH